MEVIEQIPEIRDVALFGKGLHLVAADGQKAAELVRHRLEEQAYRVERVEHILPSLEDVFVSLIEARDRKEQPQSEVER
jgi:ABC-2 type transport system ATP-binding protein